MLEAEISTKLLEVRGITKAFYGNTVLDDVSFDLAYGEVLGLVGQNGAGKSTLVKILTGAYQPDGGAILIDGKPTDLPDIRSANACGIAQVFQELSLAPNMTVADNIFIGNIPTNRLTLVKQKEFYAQTEDLIKKFAVDMKPDDLVQNLSIGKRQIVEILKAIAKKPKLLILDEPTSSLEEDEIKILFNFIEELKKNRFSIIYISHHMSEIFRIVDRVMVLRDGKKVGIYGRDEIDIEQLIRLMINQDFRSFFGGSEKRVIRHDPVFQVQGLTHEPYFRNIDLTVHRGEILGIAGIVGCGKTELCLALYGVVRAESGAALLEGKRLRLSGPSEVKQQGILFLPENRKTQGLFLDDTVRNNMIASVLLQVSPQGFLQLGRIREIAGSYVKWLNIKLRSLEQTVRFLSGGNQQKVLVAKCIAGGPKVMIAMDPTRGVDVGSKADIHRILYELTQQGMAIVMVSSELDELINMCDRIAVLNNGQVTTTFLRDRFDTEQILLAMHQSNGQGVVEYGTA